MFSRLRSLLHGLFGRSALESDIADEIRFHLETRTQDLIRSGLSEDEARRRARLEFGCIESYKEHCRQSVGLRLLDEVRGDLGYALRALRKSPSLAAVAILTLAFAVGVNTAFFAVIDTAVLHPIPVRDPSSLYEIVGRATGGVGSGFRLTEYEDLRDHSQAFQQLFADAGARVQGPAGSLFGRLVSRNYFGSLDGRTEVGRPLMPDDDTPASPPVLVLSNAAWQRHFGGDPEIVGKRINLAGHSFEVAGVAVPNFRGLDFAAAEFWAPLSARSLLDPRPHPESDPWLGIIGRLSPGVTPRQARAEMAALLPAISRSRQNDLAFIDASLESRATYQSWDQFNAEMNAVPAFIICALVLLIACSNLANLQLARAVGREREIGVRLSLGASRGRIVRQLATETIPIAAGGAALGLILARWILALLSNATGTLLRGPLFELTLDFRVFSFTLVISGLAAVLFGLLPALQATRPNLLSADKRDWRRLFVYAIRKSSLRNTLVIVQFALSLALLIGAGTLLMRTIKLMTTQAGFDTANTIAIDLSTNARDAVLPARITQQLARAPHVVSVARESGGPLGYKGGLWGTLPEASVAPGGDDSVQRPSSYDFVSAEYFSTVGLPIIRGRGFSKQEAESGAPVALISQAAAGDFWPGQDPIGRQFRIKVATRESKTPLSVQVVGVAADAVNGSIYNGSAAACVYLPMPVTTAGGFLVVRVDRDPGRLLPAIRSELTAAEPAAGLDLATLEEIRSVETLPYRIISSAAAALALAALLLASIGIYGVIAYLVSRQTREVGVRMALGARPADVLRMTLARGVRLILISIAGGLFLALEFARILAAFVSNLNANDVSVFVGSTAVLAAVGLLATYLPARKSTRVDPSVALRCE
jgi:predicted permease